MTRFGRDTHSSRSYVQWFVDDEYKPDKDYLFCLSRNYYVTLCKSKYIEPLIDGSVVNIRQDDLALVRKLLMNVTIKLIIGFSPDSSLDFGLFLEITSVYEAKESRGKVECKNFNRKLREDVASLPRNILCWGGEKSIFFRKELNFFSLLFFRSFLRWKLLKRSRYY